MVFWLRNDGSRMGDQNMRIAAFATLRLVELACSTLPVRTYTYKNESLLHKQAVPRTRGSIGPPT
jgi:hypothetical protein